MDFNFLTPHGHGAVMEHREGTNDQGIIRSIFDNDEYGIPEGLSGVAIDVGAHIGAWTVAVALDNPELRVIAIEPVPENVQLLARNVAANGLAGSRVTVIEGAATRKGGKASISYRFAGDEQAEIHRFIGNQALPSHPPSETISVHGFSLRQLAKGPIRLLKIDCEGCEYDVLASAGRDCEEIVGEYHAGLQKIKDLLPRHRVENRGDESFGLFRAVRP